MTTSQLLKIVLFIITVHLLSVTAGFAQRNLKISSLFSDHMVLQQNATITICGQSGKSERIKGSASWGASTVTEADIMGRWTIKLKTPSAGGPYTLQLQNKDTVVKINDILIGEVWLASGQSNMDIPLTGWPPGDTILNSRKEIEQAKYPSIRFFKVPFNTSATPLNEVHAIWTPISPKTAGNFSATAYFFARKLEQVLNVPIGIIQSSIGGTPAEAWTSKSSLLKLGDFNQTIEALDRIKVNSNTPTVLFNAMINPLTSFVIKGVIWYQGESNVGRAEQYKRLFPLMIDDWRKQWHYKMPFYYVQIAPSIYKAVDQKEQSPSLRNAQRFALRLPNTGMVTTLDIGYLPTAHPPFKQEVGNRLARFALNNQYGIHQVVSGPIYKRIRRSGNKLFIKFTGVGSGLQAKENGLKNFEIAGKDKSFLPADAKIQQKDVIVSNPLIAKPMYVRYAWRDSCSATLFNKEGLPAATFTSEQ